MRKPPTRNGSPATGRRTNRVQLKGASLGTAQQRYAEARVEIQVACVFMHAWSEVEHDLVYKPF